MRLWQMMTLRMSSCRAVSKLSELSRIVGVAVQHGGDGGVEHDVRAGDGVGGAEHAELELVAGEGEGGGAVAVRGVALEARQGVHAEAQLAALSGGVGGVLLQGLEDGGELVAEENGDHGGGSLVGAQTVVVARRGHGETQEVLVLVDGLDDGAEEGEELRVLMRRLARGEEVRSRCRW